MSSADQQVFLQTYARSRKQDLDLLAEKIKIREPIVSLHWTLWGAIKLCDLMEHSTARELLKSHKEKLVRYERLAHSNNVEKLLEML